MLAALHKKTGEVVWQSKDVTEQVTYSSPVAATIGGVKQYVQMVQDGVVGVEAKTGDLLWYHKRERKYPDVVCCTPVVQGEHVLASAGWGGGSELLKIDKDGAKLKATSVYSERKMLGNKQGGIILLDGNVFGSNEDRGWMCQDFLTGEKKWESERRDLPVGSVTYADGRMYCVTEGGKVGMFAATPAKYAEISRFQLPDESKVRPPNGRVWTHPVIADGHLYLRDQELLFCYKIK